MTRLGRRFPDRVRITLPVAAVTIVPVALADSGSAADVWTVTAAISLPDPNNGTGTDSLLATTAISLSDSGTETDVLLAGTPQALSESGTGTDSFEITTATLSLSDSGTGADTWKATVPISLSESGTGADSIIPTGVQPVGSPSGGPWVLAFQEEFNIAYPTKYGTGPNPALWADTAVDGESIATTSQSLAWGCHGYYACSISNSILTITCKFENPQSIDPACPNPMEPGGNTGLYTSAFLSSHPGFAFTYGYLEASIKNTSASASGTWPAFWCMPKGPQNPPEIDVDEWCIVTSGDFNSEYYNSSGSPTQYETASDSTNFHTYGMRLDPLHVTFFYDGSQISSPITYDGDPYAWVVQLDNDVHTNTSGTGFPQSFEIDYIRFWGVQGSPNPPVITSVSPADGIPSSGSVTVNFTPNGASSYRVTACVLNLWTTSGESESSVDVITNTGSTSPITVSGLTNGYPYFFTVAAINSSGPSADQYSIESQPVPNFYPEPFSDNGTGNDAFSFTQSQAFSDSGTGSDTFSLGTILISLSEAGSESDTLVSGSTQPQAFSEAGTGTDTILAVVLQALAEAGTETDSLATQITALSVTDSGTGSDVWTIVQPQALSESGTESDTFLIPTVGESLGDSGTGSDAFSAPTVSVSLTESGTGSDIFVGGGLQPIALPESGSGTDALITPTISEILTDNGVGTDTWTAVQPQNFPDSGTGSDIFVGGGAQPIALPESGAGADTLVTQMSALSITESGTGTDVWTAVQPQALTDSGTGSDALLVPTSGLSLGDSGSAIDSSSFIVSVPLADSGVGSETFTGGGIQSFPLSESGIASDALTGVAAVAIQESGSEIDTLAITIPIGLSDSGSGLDVQTTVSSVPLTDNGTGADSLFVIAFADSGTGTDTLGGTAAVPISESGTGSDTLAISIPIALPDSGHATDNVTALAAIALADAGTALDALAIPQISLFLTDSGTGLDSSVSGFPVLVNEYGSASDILHFSFTEDTGIVTISNRLAGYVTIRNIG
jgi:Glycosyl hydrolases family 16